MKSKILNALLFLVLFTLTNTDSDAQIVSNEVLTAKGDYQISSISVEEEMEDRIKRGDLLNPIGASAYDTYIVNNENNPTDHSLNKKLKRSLVAALAQTSDKALTEYFEEGGDFILKYISARTIKNAPIDEYYLVAAKLLGEDHYLYGSLKAKGHFIEALKFRYIEKRGLETVKVKLNESLIFDPDASYTYNELGLIYFEEEDYQLACENFDQAILLNAYWETPQQKLKLAKNALVLSNN